MQLIAKLDNNLGATLPSAYMVDADVYQLGRGKAKSSQDSTGDVNSVLKQYKETVYPMHKRFVEPSKSIADINISGENKMEKSVQKIITSIDSLLLKRK